MDWKREAESKLRNYTAQKNSIRRTQDEVKRLQMTLTSIRSATSDGTPVAGGRTPGQAVQYIEGVNPAKADLSGRAGQELGQGAPPQQGLSPGEG